MNYQIILPGFKRYFRARIRTFLENNWAVALYLIKCGDKLYTQYRT